MVSLTAFECYFARIANLFFFRLKILSLQWIINDIKKNNNVIEKLLVFYFIFLDVFVDN